MRPRPPTKVLSGVHTALGLLWIGDKLYVSSTARLDGYSGFDGQAFARHQTVLALPSGVGEVSAMAFGPDAKGNLLLGDWGTGSGYLLSG